jgi:hypothetical protein
MNRDSLMQSVVGLVSTCCRLTALILHHGCGVRQLDAPWLVNTVRSPERCIPRIVVSARTVAGAAGVVDSRSSPTFRSSDGSRAARSLSWSGSRP